MVTVTDDPVLASRCDRVIVMKEGQIVQSGTFEEIENGPHYHNIFTRTDAARIHGNGVGKSHQSVESTNA
jgi:ABC-type dipeptide/oligopeptide/nickel transport system ATPase component